MIMLAPSPDRGMGGVPRRAAAREAMRGGNKTKNTEYQWCNECSLRRKSDPNNDNCIAIHRHNKKHSIHITS